MTSTFHRRGDIRRDSLGRESVSGDCTQVVDSCLFAGATVKAVVKEQLEPEQEIAVKVLRRARGLKSLILQSPGFLRVQLDCRRNDAAAVSADGLSNSPSNLPEIAARKRRREGERRERRRVVIDLRMKVGDPESA